MINDFRNSQIKTAIIGSGISGLSLAYFLRDNKNLVLFEGEKRLGGHSRTINLDYQGEEIAVDTGFIVFNDRTYPILLQLFAELKLEILKTEMSFAASVNNGEIEWSGDSLKSFFAQKKAIFSPSSWRGLFDIIRFNKKALLLVNKQPEMKLGEFIEFLGMGEWFKKYYLLPMGAAIWSCPIEQMLEFPAKSFINFFHNHGLLSINNRPQWFTLKGGSINYIQKISSYLTERVRLNSKVVSLKKLTNGEKEITTEDGRKENFERVIFACHGNQALKILQDPSKEQAEILSAFKYQKNIAYTHRDIRQMPIRKICWSSWNYLSKQNEQNQLAVSYWMNKLQSLNPSKPIFVTLNPIEKIHEDYIFDEYTFEHPVFDRGAILAQKRIQNIQGLDNIWYCGAHLGYGFHEDGIKSANDLAKYYGHI
ncbi:MAG: FAD-dependent oxidoreductase [Proteobacteria bacterium]|nr:FAD-dependent oxidoreductase [Pseudomonadota bacterium]